MNKTPNDPTASNLGEHSKHANETSWKPGKSANPGGKPSLVKDLERAGALNPEIAGLTPEDARARWWAAVLPVAFAGPQRAKDSNWTYAASEVGNRLLGKPKETLEVSGGMTPEQVALFDALRMTPHERRLAAQNSTADAIEDAKAAADADDA